MNTNSTHAIRQVGIFRDGTFEGMVEMTMDQVFDLMNREKHQGSNCEFFHHPSLLKINDGVKP